MHVTSEEKSKIANVVNPNLLDNWYFARPVNQRGKTEYTTAWQYMIDRWLIASDTVTVNTGYVTLAAKSNISAIIQRFEKGFFSNPSYTLSVLTAEGKLVSHTFSPSGAYSTDGISLEISIPDSDNPYIAIHNSSTSKQVNLLAAKLELGDTQTLAHKENGEWVLNEVPDYGEQLRRCQRYCVAFKQYDAFFPIDTTDFIVELPCPMRTSPTIINSKNITNVNNPTMAWYNVGSNQLRIRSTTTHNNAKAVCSGLVLFSADP